MDAKLVEHLARLGKGAPQLPASSRTVKATLDAILQHQGHFMEGIDVLDTAAEKIVGHCRSTWK